MCIETRLRAGFFVPLFPNSVTDGQKTLCYGEINTVVAYIFADHVDLACKLITHQLSLKVLFRLQWPLVMDARNIAALFDNSLRNSQY